MSSTINVNNRNNSSNETNHNFSDVLLYAESKITRKQAVREIANVILRANMKPRTVKHALQLIKALLPPENTLPATVDELFGAMLSSENDWRLAQYLIRHKQRPSFLSSPNSWNENSNSNISTETSALFFPISSNSSEDSSDSQSSSSSSSSSTTSDDDDDDDDDERNILFALQNTQQQQQQQRLLSSSPTRSTIETADNNRSTNNTSNQSSDQRSQIVSNSLNRFPFVGSFKRQRNDSTTDESDCDPDVFYTTRILDDDSDTDTPFYSISNSNNNSNNKSCCFEMNGCDLLDGGKRRRH